MNLFTAAGHIENDPLKRKVGNVRSSPRLSMLSIYLVADSLFCYRRKKGRKVLCTAPSHGQLFFWKGRECALEPIVEGIAPCGLPAAAHGRHRHSSLVVGWEQETLLGAFDAVNDVVWCRSRAATTARNRDAELSTHLSFFSEFSCSPHLKH